MITSTRRRLDHSHSLPQWPALRVIAFNLLPYPSLYNIPPSLHSPLTILCVHFLAVFNPSVHMLCWHIACCVCQLVNARCTAADKDQKDITNNRLLTGERDTQVPLRKSPLSQPSPAVCPTTLISGSLHSKALALLLPRSLFGWCLYKNLTEPLDWQIVLTKLKCVKLHWHFHLHCNFLDFHMQWPVNLPEIFRWWCTTSQACFNEDSNCSDYLTWQFFELT